MVDVLAQRLARGEARLVRRATDHDLCGFIAERSRCHKNVDRWCRLHPKHRVVRGWLVTSSYVLDRHSLVDIGEIDLMDITPMPDEASRLFLPHDGGCDEFETLPNQLIITV